MKKIVSIIVSIGIFSLFVLSNVQNTFADNKSVNYQTHVQDVGWQEWKSNGELSGTENEAKRLEGIKINVDGLPKGTNILYRTHIQDIGWQEWKTSGEISGTEGLAKRLEAIQIKLEGYDSIYQIEYRVHVQDIGWQEWKCDGEVAGTEGLGKRLEAIQIRLNSIPSINYQTHIQNIGWQEWKQNGELSGTENEAKRLEGINISLNNVPPGMGIRYRTHIQDFGWQDWKSNGETSGTEGLGKRLEAIQIELMGAPVGYRIEYRVHIQDQGWSSWVGNGKVAGTEGKNKRLEAIEIKLTKNNNRVVVLDPGHGGHDSGAVGAGFKEKFLNLEIGLAAKKYLLQNGVEVVMTRETDKYLSIAERADLANSINPDLFISIHNDSGSETATGAHVIYSLRDKNGGATKTLAGNILNKITSMTTQNANGRKIWTKENSEGRDWYGVVRESSNPAVIVECAFMNIKDIKAIEDGTLQLRAVDTPEKRDAMGKAIAYGILETLNESN